MSQYSFHTITSELTEHDDHCVSIIPFKSAIHLSPNIVDVLDADYYQHQDLILNNFDFQIDVDYYQDPDFILISSSRAVDPPMRPCGVFVLLKPSVTPNNL